MTVYTPEYQGKMLRSLLGVKKSFPDEPTLMAHVNLYLLQMCVRACLWYHMGCVGINASSSPVTTPDGTISPSQMVRKLSSKASAFHSHSSESNTAEDREEVGCL